MRKICQLLIGATILLTGSYVVNAQEATEEKIPALLPPIVGNHPTDPAPAEDAAPVEPTDVEEAVQNVDVTPNYPNLPKMFKATVEPAKSALPALPTPAPASAVQPTGALDTATMTQIDAMREESGNLLDQADQAESRGDTVAAQQLREQATTVFRQSYLLEKGKASSAVGTMTPEAVTPEVDAASVPSNARISGQYPTDEGQIYVDDTAAYYTERMSPKASALMQALEHLVAAYDILNNAPEIPVHLMTPVRMAAENLQREAMRMERSERTAIRAQMQQRLNLLRQESSVLESMLRRP